MLSIFVWACDDDSGSDPSPEDEAKEYVFQAMSQWYLWNDQLPAEFDDSSFPTPESVMAALKYQPLDRWSYVGDRAAYEAFFEEGKTPAFGFVLKWSENDELYVAQSYADSPADLAGISRGARITAIDGQDVQSIGNFNQALGADEVGVSVDFDYVAPDGTARSATLTKDTITVNTVMHTSVHETSGRTVGYLVFDSFIVPSIGELETAFAELQAAGCNELVLDLRYNGGGRVDVAANLASRIVPRATFGQTFTSMEHNADRSDRDTTYNFVSNAGARLDLDRVFIVGTGATASASELIINGLRPYMDVYLIGANTYGKPVGSYGFLYEEYVVSVVALRLANSAGVADYYDGFAPDASAFDGLAFPYGDEDEPSLKAALHYIETGSFPSLPGRFGRQPSDQRIVLPEGGLRREMGLF